MYIIYKVIINIIEFSYRSAMSRQINCQLSTVICPTLILVSIFFSLLFIILIYKIRNIALNEIIDNLEEEVSISDVFLFYIG